MNAVELILTIASAMKSFIIFATAAFASLTTADVQTFSDTQCSANRQLVQTVAGRCYNAGGDRRSMLGCSVSHNLKIFTKGNCDESGPSQVVAPQHCVNAGGFVIGSFKCLN